MPWRIVVLIILWVLLLLAADYHRFVLHTAELKSCVRDTEAPIIVLTGGSGLRIVAALDLYRGHERPQGMLVSGVHESVTIDSLAAASGVSVDVLECCVELGREARSTEGNAMEVRNWVEAQDVPAITLVTSNYHLPRATLWFETLLPETEISQYPVQSQVQPQKWWRSWQSFRGLATEWAKYRTTQVLLFTGAN